MKKLRLGKLSNQFEFTVGKWHGQDVKPGQVVYLRDKPMKTERTSDAAWRASHDISSTGHVKLPVESV